MAKNILRSIGQGFKTLGLDMKDIGQTFAHGDWKTRVSYVIMGFGQLMRGQIVRGVTFLAMEALMLYFIIGFGAQYISKLGTLGTVGRIVNPNGTVSYGDNSFFILLFGILTIIVILLLVLLWRMNIRQNRDAQRMLEAGRKLPTNMEDLRSLLHERFDRTLLALPVTGIFIFTVLPILFMIGVAFTNYDSTHQPPANLFSWVGLDNFRNIVSLNGEGSFAGMGLLCDLPDVLPGHGRRHPDQ